MGGESARSAITCRRRHAPHAIASPSCTAPAASEVRGFDDWIMVLEAGFQDVVFVGLAVVFVRGIETRLVRKDALVGLHELRSVAHVIDMHQLTKDPEALLRPDQRTEHSPPRNLNRFELTR